MEKKILIIDDDQKLNTLLINYLKKFNLAATAVTHPHDGISLLEKEMPDLIILDIMLPDMDGFEVCKTIRKKYIVPIVMLTARGDVTDRIVGLEIGADDYLPKPFEPRELVARIQSIFRRAAKNQDRKQYKYRNLVVNLKNQKITLNNKEINLTTSEFKILKLFIENSGKILSRDVILNEIRSIEWEAFDRSVDVIVSRLRSKLGDNPKNPFLLKTMWGSGYMFIGEENEDK